MLYMTAKKRKLEEVWDHIAVINEEMGVIKADVGNLKDNMRTVRDKMNKIDDRLWHILVGIIIVFISVILSKIL